MARPYRPNVDQQIIASHRAWLGLLQPEGLVVSAAALREAGLVVDTSLLPLRDTLVALRAKAPRGLIPFRALAHHLLGWRERDLASPPPDLTVAVPEFPGDLLAPTLVLNDLAGQPQLLVVELPPGPPPDPSAPSDTASRHPFDATTDLPGHWPASPQSRLERLLRDTKVPLGLLYDGLTLRLTYAPRGETSGHLTFPMALMATTDGRVVLGALQMLLGVYRLFPGDPSEHLLALCAKSRDYQNTVSTQLADQVLDALNHLLQGFSRADQLHVDPRDRIFTRTFRAAARPQDGAPQHDDPLAGGTALATGGPEHIYGGLLTTIMRLVFMLYAEERGLLPDDPVYLQGYSVRRLYERLREDHGRHPDAMDQRFGAWAQLVALFRLVHNGVRSQAFTLPQRQGELFDPDLYPFLEGRLSRAHQRVEDGPTPRLPRVPDGAIYRILEKLIMLEGERLSYRALAVEQIGSVYQNMMGFEVKLAPSPLMVLTPQSIPVELEALLDVPKKDRKKHLEALLKPAKVGTRLTEPLAQADALDALEAALIPMASRLSPRLVPAGAFYLEPTDERRRSGTHYTPQALTEPIVRKTLEPLLADLARSPRARDGVPHPDELLDLKVCDPAMGSAAFLVEVCRQLGAVLELGWQKFGKPRVRRANGSEEPLDPSVETLIHAQRFVAERCVYGVDKNPFAVTLGKLSLWLATLAKDRAFTFVDDSIRHGDSLVGLTRAQLGAFTWEVIAPDKGKTVETHPWVRDRMNLARSLREQIVKQQGSEDYEAKRRLLLDADDQMRDVRLLGDAAVASYFAAESDKARKAERDRLAAIAMQVFQKQDTRQRHLLEVAQGELRGGAQPLTPFHWEVEFPEVFDRANPGFDAFVGNPPFAGKNTTASGNRDGFVSWIQTLHEGSHGNADLVAHFFRRTFDLLRRDGTLGLIATNTIGQGDTRATGLTWIRTHGGHIFAARKRVRWPGAAAVIVSVVHVIRGPWEEACDLDGVRAPRITAYLVPSGTDATPDVLAANAGLSFQGSVVLGMGFTFDDASSRGVGGSLADYERLAADPHNAERLFPYIGGEELNSDPRHLHRRYVINFGQMSEDEARQWPELMRIVEEKVKPDRLKLNREGYRQYWWQYGEKRVDLYRRIHDLEFVIAIPRVSSHFNVTRLPTGMVYSDQVVIVALDTYAAFAALQGRVHEVWARLNASSMKDDLRYTPTDCFETFPFPEGWQTHPGLEAAGKAYYEHRAALMIANDEGLTKTYNRFHDDAVEDAYDPGIARLRALHAAMDRAVIEAYGWDPDALDLRCHFLAVHAEDDDGDDEGRRKKKRLRWSDETRDLILGRLLELNERRAAPAPATGDLLLTAPPSRPTKKAGAASKPATRSRKAP